MSTIHPDRLKRLFDACPELRPAAITNVGSSMWISIDGNDHLNDEISHALIERQILVWLTMRLSEMGGALMVRHLAGRFWLSSAFTPAFAAASLFEACVCAAEWVKGLPKWEDSTP